MAQRQLDLFDHHPAAVGPGATSPQVSSETRGLLEARSAAPVVNREVDAELRPAEAGREAGRPHHPCLLNFTVPRTVGQERAPHGGHAEGAENGIIMIRGAVARQRYYDAMVEELKARYKIAIRKWRKHMSGVAYELKYRDGTIKRLITAPRPRSPVSASIFLHEVGHHAIGFRRYKPRCLEEYYVWQWAFREMQTRQIPIDPRVLRHYRRSMFHYVRMAKRRGIKELPGELHQFLHWPG
ncbi:MAG: hypothetical protein WCI73_13825 [Phycisphaerae bacterium]